MKIVRLLLIALLVLPSFGYAAEDNDLPAKTRDQIEAQTRAMSAVGVPSDAARNMLTLMHQNRFKAENIVRAQQTVMDCARQGLPAEPVMSKAVEGMAKHAGEQQIIAAMETVQSRYAHANRLAKALSDDNVTVDALTDVMADGMAAGMKAADMDAVMAQLQTRTRQQARTRDQAEDQQQLMIQTMQTVRTMARLGVHSSDVTDTLCQALQHQYTSQEMKQLRHQMAQEVHQASAQQIASRHAGAIGKGGGAGSAAGGSGSGPGGGGSGSGPGGGGSGSGPGGGGSGSGPGGGGSGSGPGGGGSGGGPK